MNWIRFLYTLALAVAVASPPAAAAAAAADLALSLPLGPYFRPGRYLPVHVTAAFAHRGNNWIGVGASSIAGRLEIGKGAGRSGIELIDGRVDAIVPWLVMDARAGRPRLFAEEPFEFVDGPELRELAPVERLVGWTSPDEPFARELLPPGTKVIPVALDPARPIVGNAAAWEMLDAIILDAASAARLDQAQLAGLVACGVTVAARTDCPPFPTWPWRRRGAYSVLSHVAAGPALGHGDAATASVYCAPAYSPVASWQAGWTWAFRRRVLLIAAVCCVLILGLAIWRPPLAALWVAILAGLMCAGIGKWSGLHLPIQQAAGEVVVIGDALTQTDGWSYQTAAADDVATLKWVDVTRPVFAGRGGRRSARRTRPSGWRGGACKTRRARRSGGS
jgi:hypothetical protein